MTIQPITLDLPTCLGVACPKHHECARKTEDIDHTTIAECDEQRLFVPKED